MRALSLSIAGLALAVAPATAAAKIETTTLKPPSRSPVTFSAKVMSGGGRSEGLKRGTHLKPGQTIKQQVRVGRDLVQPRDCPCIANLAGIAGQPLRSGYVEVISRRGKQLAVAPTSKLFLPGNGPNDSAVQFAFDSTTGFPSNAYLVVYAFFSKR
jgi:hypothetical protein